MTERPEKMIKRYGVGFETETYKVISEEQKEGKYTLYSDTKILIDALVSIRGWREIGCSDDFDRFTAEIFGNIADEALKEIRYG